MNKNTIILAIGALLLLLGIGASSLLMPSKEKNVSTSETEVQITANNIYKSFANDESAANELYAGKIIEVSGVLQEIGEGEADVLQLTLRSEDQMGNVVCNMTESNRDAIKSIQIGKEITIKGLCTGYLFDVVIDQASIVKS